MGDGTLYSVDNVKAEVGFGRLWVVMELRDREQAQGCRSLACVLSEIGQKKRGTQSRKCSPVLKFDEHDEILRRIQSKVPRLESEAGIHEHLEPRLLGGGQLQNKNSAVRVRLEEQAVH